MLKTLVALALGVTLPLDAAEPRRITLEEALRLAEASPAAKALAAELARARAEVRGAGLWPNPEVSLSRESTGDGRDEFALLSQPIPLSGRLGLERSAAGHGLEAAERRTRQGRVELRMRVRDAFFELLGVQERTAALESGRTRLSELVRVLEAREREGESSGFDRMRAERERADVESELFVARGRLDRARASFASLLALPTAEALAEGSLAHAAELPGLDEVRRLVGSRGDLEALVAEAERADRLAAAAGRRAIPEPALTAGFKRTTLGALSDSGPVFGLSLTIPLFDRGQGGRAVAHAEAELLLTRHASARIEALGEAEAALAEASRRREAEKAYAAGSDPDGLVRIATAAYEEGEMRILELLDAHRTALAARLKRIDLLEDARRAEAALNRAVGSELVP
jgi:cobalt-zinc-cadmium efflux system outer membrane protein